MTEEKPDYITETEEALEMLGAGYEDKTIIRVVKNKDNPFVMIDKRPLEDKSLTWKAKGLLAYLLSRPDNWIIRMGDLVKRSKDGEHSVRKAMKELREAGHIKMEAIREGGKIKEWTYIIFEVPVLDGDFQQVEKLQVENLTLNKIDSNKKDLSKKDLTTGDKSPGRTPATIEEAVFANKPVTPDLLETEDEQFLRDVEDATFLICQGQPHYKPLVRQFMESRRIILDYEKKAQGGHRKVLKALYNAKPHRVEAEHIKQAVEYMFTEGLTCTDLFSVQKISIDFANPAPGSEQIQPTSAIDALKISIAQQEAQDERAKV